MLTHNTFLRVLFFLAANHSMLSYHAQLTRNNLQLATSKLVYNLGLGSSLPEATFRTKIGGVWAGLGEYPNKM